MISEIIITIDDGPEEGFYLEHFDALATKVEALLRHANLESYSVEGNPDPNLSPPTKEDIADYKTYHKGEGIHTP